MQGALEEIPGVDHADVDFENGTATVAVEPGLDPQQLIDAVVEAGAGKYQASLK